MPVPVDTSQSVCASGTSDSTRNPAGFAATMQAVAGAQPRQARRERALPGTTMP